DFIAIVDDVVTTGSTANEIANVLKKAGVERVEIWAFARA
ncbi:MAG: ComF family protein, partial [Cycloclasticus sp.]|nr:ComF family protein [Cycloclasticus sp.]